MAMPPLDPDEPADAVEIDIEPLVDARPAPVNKVTEPPSWVTLLPAASKISPPLDNELTPTLRLIEPDEPSTVFPVLTLTDPESAPVAEPEATETAPLLPVSPPEADSS
jgi:hypothetical protein